MMHTQGAFVLSLFVMVLICVSVALIVAQTLPVFWDGETLLRQPFWDASELIVTLLFTAEYAVRFWCAHPTAQAPPHIRQRALRPPSTR